MLEDFHFSSDIVFDNEAAAADYVLERFLSGFRYTRQGVCDLEALETIPKDLERLKIDTDYVTIKAGKGTSRRTIRQILAHTDRTLWANICVEYGAPRGLLPDGRINKRPELLCDMPDPLEPEDTSQLDQAMAEFEAYWDSRSSNIVEIKGNTYKEMDVVASALYGLVSGNTGRQLNNIFFQGEQGTGKSMIADNVPLAMLGPAAVCHVEKWLPEKFTPAGYEGSRLVIIQEASPTSSGMSRYKQISRDGRETIEKKGREAYELKTQHPFFLYTNNDFIPEAIIEDRGTTIIGFDNKDPMPPLIASWLGNERRCPCPIAFAKELKFFFELRNDLWNLGLVCNGTEIKTAKRRELALNNLEADGIYPKVVMALKCLGGRSTADELVNKLNTLGVKFRGKNGPVEFTGRTLGLKLRPAIAIGSIFTSKEHSRLSTTTYYSLNPIAPAPALLPLNTDTAA